jgi:hypothetical protein
MNVLKIVGVNAPLLESCTFGVKSPNVKPIYEYKDGQRTEKVIGYLSEVVVLNHGPLFLETLEIRTEWKISEKASDTIKIKVDNDKTKVYLQKGYLKCSFWVFDIMPAETEEGK